MLLNALNYGAAALHGFQAVAVFVLIYFLDQKHPGAPPLVNGRYPLYRNVFVLRLPGGVPRCDLPELHNLTLADQSANSMSLMLGGDLLIESTYFYRFGNAFAIPNNFEVGTVDLRYLLAAFFLMSCLFQLADGLVGTYSTNPKGPRLLRFVEYSFSASVMVMAISLEMGIFDLYTLVCILALIFATNILGLIAEALMYMVECSPSLWDAAACPGLVVQPACLWVFPHVLGWIVCVAGYAPLLDSYRTSISCSEQGPPGFVSIIVLLEFNLFLCFGFVQLWSLYRRTMALGNMGSAYKKFDSVLQGPPKGGDETSEEIVRAADFAYILLSFTAKTVLAWLILAPTL